MRKDILKLRYIMVVVLMVIGITLVNGAQRKDCIAVEDSNAIDTNNSYITSVGISQMITGTAPFDPKGTTDSSNSDGSVNWKAGDDENASNNIVRSFDQITYTVASTMNLAEDVNMQDLSICIKAEITDKTLAKQVKWDKDSMNWAVESNLSEDGLTYEAKYNMKDVAEAASMQQNLVMVLKTLGAANGSEIEPEFTVWLDGNDKTLYKTKKADKVYISSVPKYNIKLTRNRFLANKVTVNYDGVDKRGRVYGYGIILQLYNEDKNKGLKGVEYPKGDITFDIDLNLTRTEPGSSVRENITKECTPLLWNYKVNSYSITGNISGRNMYFGSNTNTQFERYIPYGLRMTDRTSCVYNSGKIEMSQEYDKDSNKELGRLKVKISGYNFDGEFPKYFFNYKNSPHSSINYTPNIGCFSTGYFQVLVPDNEASTVEGKNYYIEVKDINFSAISLSGVNVSTQMVTTDDGSSFQHVINKTGGFYQNIFLNKYKGATFDNRSR